MAERTVNERQLEVLRWIVEGCPDGVMSDATYKTTAVALQNRRLVTVSKKKGAWKAEATSAGRHFVEHGSYPEGHWQSLQPPAIAHRSASHPTPGPSTEGTPGPPRARSRRITGRRPVDQMLADAEAAGPEGFTIEDGDRSHFENLIRSAEQYGKVPGGKRLRIERDEACRLRVRVVDQPAGTADSAPAISVSDRLDRPHPVVRSLRDAKRPERMRGAVRNRALRLLDALAKEAERRGYRVDAPSPEPGSRVAKGHLEISINGHSYAVAIDELTERIPHQPTQRELREQERHPWRRVPTHDEVPSGRLRLRILGWSSHQDTFKETKTINLATRLTALLEGIEVRAAENEQRRLEREREATERRQRWERVREEAVLALVENHRAKILLEQVDRWRQVKELDEYLAELAQVVTSLTGGEAEAGRAWIDWAQGYRERHDPIRHPIALPADPEPTPEALKPFMRGLSLFGPAMW